MCCLHTGSSLVNGASDCVDCCPVVKKTSIMAVFMHALVTLIMLGMLDRSWLLLGVERGTIFGSCDMDLGLPWWLAVDKWAPFIFEVKTACGYTPELFLGITMAEALLVFSALMLLLSSIMLVAVLLAYKKQLMYDRAMR